MHHGMGNQCIVTMGMRAADGILLIEMGKSHIEYSRLYLVHPRVAPLIVEHVFGRRPIVAQRTDDSGQFVIVGCDGTRIAQGTKIFRWIEAMSRSIAKRPRHAILKTTAVCLRVVLHQQKAMAAAGFRNLVRVGTAAEQVIVSAAETM